MACKGVCEVFCAVWAHVCCVRVAVSLPPLTLEIPYTPYDLPLAFHYNSVPSSPRPVRYTVIGVICYVIATGEKDTTSVTERDMANVFYSERRVRYTCSFLMLRYLSAFSFFALSIGNT